MTRKVLSLVTEEHKIFSSRVWGRSESRFLEAVFRKPSCQGRHTSFDISVTGNQIISAG